MSNERNGLTTREQIEETKLELTQPVCSTKHWWKSCKKHISRTIYSIVLLLLLLIAYNILRLRATGNLPHVFGYYFFRIESGSMDPTLKIGDIILSKTPSNPEDLSVGTIVTYYSETNEVITHRITDKDTDTSGNVIYETKGDYSGNATDLGKLTPERIIAVYSSTLFHSKSN